MAAVAPVLRHRHKSSRSEPGRGLPRAVAAEEASTLALTAEESSTLAMATPATVTGLPKRDDAHSAVCWRSDANGTDRRAERNGAPPAPALGAGSCVALRMALFSRWGALARGLFTRPAGRQSPVLVLL